MRHAIRLLSIFGLMLGLTAGAFAQANYPERPVRFVIAFPPGGATDTFFRAISHEYSQALGGSIVIENRGGAGGYIAWQHVAAAANDGYTVLVAENALGINQALFKKHPSGFNPLVQYDAVAAMANTALAWTVANKVPANNFKEFIAWAKSRPTKFDYGHAGPGSVSHLVPEVIFDGAGIQGQPVPFRGGGPAAQAVAGGHVDVVTLSVAVAKGQVEGKLAKTLFVTSKNRSPAMPDVPSLSELGLKFADVDLDFWWGLFVPKGVPEPIKAKLEAAMKTTMSNPAVRERLIKVGTDPTFAPGPALRTKLEREIANWSKFIDAKGITMEQK
ncbi:MAG: tripartite tricarboxylate transporter substrate binding protein [Alphaproteobacteria bacterium]|nr:tripartite tricarboxylate transporter substrate binding protein [Alphaproteobacteria bacterium]